MTEDFQETPQDTLVAFAKMILASAGYRVSNYEDPTEYSAYFCNEPGKVPRKGDHAGCTRIEAWARCANDWTDRFAPQVDLANAASLARDTFVEGKPNPVQAGGFRREKLPKGAPQSRSSKERHPKPPIPPFAEWPA